MPSSASFPAFDQWRQLAISDLRELYEKLPWILAGGYAIETWLGRSFRAHGDVDILVPRAAQQSLQEYHNVEDIYVNDWPGHLAPITAEAYFEEPIFSFWICHPDRKSWAVQVMLFDEDEGDWLYKRNPAIRRPVEEIMVSRNGVRILRPEIQLLYKSKTIRPRDQLDFEQVLPKLAQADCQWLAAALRQCYAQGHPWLAALTV